MRHLLATGVLVSIFALSGGTALANENNDGRMDHGPNIPCRGLYTAGVGWPNPSPINPHGATVGTPGFEHVDENDAELCHSR